MKHLYHFLLLCACLSWLPTQAQNWRPFRPNGDVHAFRNAAADTIWTMRLDSAAVSGPDSVYYFNRTVKRTGSGTLGTNWRKSANNQFGRQLRYNVAQRTYVLLWNGGTLLPAGTLDIALVLKPFVPVGTTWISANADVAMQTTLLSRSTMQLDGVTDSIATFRVGSSLMVVLSKNNGLVSAPQDLRIGSSTPKLLTLARRPDAAGRSYYNPLSLLDLQPGDELGYYFEPLSISMFSCYNERTLRRVSSRQVTADSVIYIFWDQAKTTYSGAPGCGPAGSTLSPVRTVRQAASRRSGAWNSIRSVELLAYGYKQYTSGSSTSLSIGFPIVPGRVGGTCGGVAMLKQSDIYSSGNGVFRDDYAIDAPGWQQLVAAGVGIVRQNTSELVYIRRTVNSATQICGSAADFATLLPARAAQALSLLQLFPNPASTTATLTLPTPARANATVRLLDGLGRAVRTQPLTAGQTTATLPLQGLAGGLYVVEVLTPGEAPQRARLQHQP